MMLPGPPKGSGFGFSYPLRAVLIFNLSVRDLCFGNRRVSILVPAPNKCVHVCICACGSFDYYVCGLRCGFITLVTPDKSKAAGSLHS